MRQLHPDAAVLQDMQSSATLLLALGCAAGLAGIVFGLRALAGGKARLSRRRELGGSAARAVGVLTVLLSITYLAYVVWAVAAFRRAVLEMDERLHPRPPAVGLRIWRDESGPHSPDRPADVPDVVDHRPRSPDRRTIV